VLSCLYVVQAVLSGDMTFDALSLTTILSAIHAVVLMVTTACLTVFGVLLFRNKRRHIAQWTYLLIPLTLAEGLLSLALKGLGLNLVSPAVQLVVLIALHITADPSLREERRLQFALRRMDARSAYENAASQGMAGRDLTGKGYISLDFFNLFWLFLFVPFSIITVTKFYGISGVLTYCIGIWLLMVFNNYWFLLCRTLMGERIWWLALPVVVYGGIAAALFIPDNSPLFDCFVNLGEGFITGNILSFIGVLAAIALMWFINRTLMQKLIYNELNKVEDTRIKHVSEYKFLDRYGEIGEYMRLELKLLLRNKICKRSLYSITGVVIMFSSIISFSDVYDGGLRDFFVLYNYIIFGIMFLSTLMGYEGNYIDGLMSRKESIYSLLRAKYILYSIALLIPTILMIPGMVTGKVSVLGCIAWLIFIPGAVYCCLFQLAVYNNKTTDLNSKMTSRQNIGTGLQNLISGGAFGIPLLLLFALNAIFGKEVTPWILIGIGVAFIATSKFWLMNVYHRLMKRRYKNMEGFRDSRQK